MKKDIDNKEKNNKKRKKTVHSLKLIYKQAIEVNNELKWNVDGQQDDIKHLKEQCDNEN